MATATFTSNGAVQTWQVPSNLSGSTVTIALTGGGTPGQAGATNGASITATVPVTPGDTLTLYLANAASVTLGAAAPFGYHLGGSANQCYAGGSSSAILNGAGTLLAEAAGAGGGYGYNGYGGGSGGVPNGATGNYQSGLAGGGTVYGGAGATQSAGGAGGTYVTNSGGINGGAGTVGGAVGSANGGIATNQTVPSSSAQTNPGCGGGGYAGGGGGASGIGYSSPNFDGGGAAGGGGSSWVIGSATGVSYAVATQAVGSLTITYTVSTVPGPVTNLSGTPGNGQVALTWTAPSGSVTGYQVWYKTFPGTGLDPATYVGNITGTSITVTGLTNDTTYYFVVIPYNSSGTGAATASSGYTPISTPTVTVTYPTSGASFDASKPWSVTWSVSNPDGSPQTAFAVRYKTSGSYSYWDVATNSASSSAVYNSTTNTSWSPPAGIFVNGNTYYVSVSVQTADGATSPFPTDISFTTVASPTVSVTGPTGSVITPEPTVTYSAAAASGHTLTAYRIVVYPQSVVTAAGFVAGQAAGSAFDTGVVNASPPGGGVTVGTYLTDLTNFVAYMQVTQSGGAQSPWVAGAVFTTNYSESQPSSVTQGAIAGENIFSKATFGRPLNGTIVLPSYSADPFEAVAIDYQTVELQWDVPNIGYQLRLVRNSFSVPRDQGDGTNLGQFPFTQTPFYVDSLPATFSGRWLYYSLFMLTAANGVWLRSADCQVLLPANFGTGENMFNLLPAWVRALDQAQVTASPSMSPPALIDNWSWTEES